MNSTPDLMTFAGRSQLDGSIAALLRIQQYDRVETILGEALRAYPSPASALCAELPREKVTVEGWAHFNERLAQEVRSLPATTVELSLSNYTDDADDGLRHPVVEIGYWKDGIVAFSRESRSSLAAMIATYPAPWAGAPDDDGCELIVHGLERLNDWLIRYDADDERQRAGAAAAQWFLLLRYHQAIAQCLEAQGLVVDVPVIVGAHDVGPWCYAVLGRGKAFIGGFPAADDPRKRADLLAEIDYQIHTWENVRAGREMMHGRGTRAYYQNAREWRDMADRWFAATPFAGTYPLELDEAAFARFLNDWRRYRDPSWTPPAASTPAPRPTALRGVFGRRGL